MILSSIPLQDKQVRARALAKLQKRREATNYKAGVPPAESTEEVAPMAFLTGPASEPSSNTQLPSDDQTTSPSA